jgi:hypothetical protein
MLDALTVVVSSDSELCVELVVVVVPTEINSVPPDDPTPVDDVVVPLTNVRASVVVETAVSITISVGTVVVVWSMIVDETEGPAMEPPVWLLVVNEVPAKDPVSSDVPLVVVPSDA